MRDRRSLSLFAALLCLLCFALPVRAQDTVKAVAKVMPAVAAVEENGHTIATAFCVHPRGVFVTCDHCCPLNRDCKDMILRMHSGKLLKVKVIVRHKCKDTAILAAWSVLLSGEHLPFIHLPHKDCPTIGLDVLVIGNPQGEWEFSASKGILAALNRKVTFSDGVTQYGMIQHTAPTQGGCSGGPLVDMQGKLLGMHDGSSGDGVHWAVPASTIRQTLTETLGSLQLVPECPCMPPAD